MVENRRRRVSVSKKDGLNPIRRNSKTIADIVTSSIVPKMNSFSDSMKSLVNYIGTPPSIETEIINSMTRRMSAGLDAKLLNMVDKNGDFTIPGCKTAVFRDNPELRGTAFDSMIVDDPMKGTREGLRNVVKNAMPIGRDFNDILEELKEKPETIHTALQKLINKNRIEQ